MNKRKISWAPKLNKLGFSHIEFVIVLIVIGLVAFIGVKVFERSHAATPSMVAAVPSASSPCHTGITPVPITHVVVVLEENENYQSVIGSSSAPYINGLANQCGLAANYHNADHPSAPNYVDLTSGQIAGGTSGYAYSNDCTYSVCPQSQNNIFNELDGAGLSWKNYAESMPSNCDITNTSLYAMRHAPAAFYTDIHATTCPRNDVPLSNSTTGGPTLTPGALYNDVANGTLPSLSYVSPNLCDDGHSTISSISYCSNNKVANLDNWLRVWTPYILNGSNYRSGNTELVVVFDEGEGGDRSNPETCWDSRHASTSSYPSCWTTAVFVGPNTPALRSTASFNHFNLLDSLTSIFRVGTLTSSSYATGSPTTNSINSTFNFNAQSSPQPTINSLTASPSTLVVNSGGSTLAWTTSNTTGCSVTPGGPTNTMSTAWLTPTFTTIGTNTYTLTCQGNGATVSRSVTVTVTAATTMHTIVGINLGSKCLDNQSGLSINLNPVVLYTCNGTNEQKWSVNSNGSIVNSNGYCLDVKGDNTAAGTPVDIYSCNGTGAQIWQVNSTNHTIVNPHSGLCIDDRGAKTTDNNEIWMYTCNGSSAQQWQVE